MSPARQPQPSILDEILRGASGRAAPREDAPEIPAEAPPPASRQAPKRFTVNLPPPIIERARTAAYYSPGLTLAELAEMALTHEIDRIEAERGEPFPADRVRLKPGRPIR